MTDLIARLEELEKVATPGPWRSRWYVEGATQEEWGPASPLVARIEYANSNCVGKRHIPWSQTDSDLLSELRNNLPTILHALKVQQAAEAYVEAREAEDAFVDEREGEGEYSDAEARSYTRLATKRMLAHSLLVAAVKGEQP